MTQPIFIFPQNDSPQIMTIISYICSMEEYIGGYSQVMTCMKIFISEDIGNSVDFS